MLSQSVWGISCESYLHVAVYNWIVFLRRGVASNLSQRTESNDLKEQKPDRCT